MTTGPTPDDYRDFGPELIDFTQRVAGPVVHQHVGRLENQVASLQTELTRERVQRVLDADPTIGGTWRTINADPAFLDWANETDAFNGEPRLSLLRRAYDLGAADRVTNIFRAYVAQRIPARQRTREETPFEGRRQPRITVREHVDRRPGVRARMWRRAEISAFYKDVARGLYDGREVKKQRIENEIAAAARESRISDPPLQMATK